MKNDKKTKENSKTLNDSDHLNFLISLRDYYGIYHHHKENMAWVALVVYLGIATTSLIYYDSLIASLSDPFKKILISSPVVIIEFLLIVFVIWEFWYRRIATNLAAACTTSISRFLEGKITAEDFKEPKETIFNFWGHEVKSGYLYLLPTFIVEEYKTATEKTKILANELVAYILMGISFFGLIVYYFLKINLFL